MQMIFIYVTTPSVAEAKKIAQAVLDDKTAACANILPGMISIYPWQGKREEAQETVLILKTRAGLFAAVESRIKELHSYDNPCIAAIPVSNVTDKYLGWIFQETNQG